MVAYDDVIVLLGNFGRYQKRIYFLLCLPAISCALHKLSGVFLQAKMNHRCQLPNEYSNASYALDSDKMNMLYPWDAVLGQPSSCTYYDLGNYQDLSVPKMPPNKTISCSAWIYDTSVYENTIVSQWDLVCDKAWFRATSDALLMTGVMLGSIIFGDLSDRLGRRLIFFISLVMQVVFGVLVGVAPDVYTYMLSRLVVGATTSGVFLVAYVLALEMVGPKARMVAGVVFQLFFTTGFILTAGFAYFIRDWRELQIALTLPGLAFLCYWWFIPESVRWLLTKGRYEEAKEILKKAGKENNKIIPDSMLNELCTETEKEKSTSSTNQKKSSLLDLFKYPNLRKKSLVIFFLWFVNSGSYYGLSWNTSNLGGNNYVNFIISGLVEVPAYSFLLLTLNKWGRKLILCGSMITAGVFLVMTVFVPDDQQWLNIALAMAGKLAITASYGTVYVFSAEQFPTVIRNVGLGAASTFARVGGIAAPYVNIMAEIWKPLPLLVFGSLALLGGSLALVLPETLNRKLPDTVSEGEMFGKKHKTDAEAEPSELKTLNADKNQL